MSKQAAGSNEITVTLRNASKLIAPILADENSHAPIYLHSSPGIGKSSLVAQICEEHSLGMVDLRLAMLEPSDIGGIPYVVQESGEMRFSTPSWFPEDPDSKGIIFLDELSNANVSTQHAAYRLVLDRTIQNGRKLPPGWKIVAAGNLKSDKTGAKEVAPALANRFGMHLFITANVDDWTAYAISRGLNEQIIGFLNFRKDALYRFDPYKNDMAFASPRSWEQASYLMNVGYDEESLNIALSGCVGQGTTMDFDVFRKYYSKLPDFNKVMDGEMEYQIPTDDIGITFAVVSSLIFCMIDNYDNDARMKVLLDDGGLVSQLGDDFKILLFKSIKNSTKREVFMKLISKSKKIFAELIKYIPD